MTEEQRREKVEYLRKQRDGEIQGGYRDLLADTYCFLKQLCEENAEGYCNPYNNQICMAVYGNTYHMTMISKFVYALQNLGYIRIVGTGANRKIYIEKELDF